MVLCEKNKGLKMVSGSNNGTVIENTRPEENLLQHIVYNGQKKKYSLKF